jgi:hypothetical protein
MQHLNKHACNVHVKKQMKYLEQMLATYVYNHCNMCNIPIYFCNIHIKHLQRTSETPETLEIYTCNMWFQRNISLLLGRMEARRRVEFTVVELDGGAKLAAPVEKTAAGPAENAAASFHTAQVERDLCVCELHLGHRELRAGGFNPSHIELGRRSARCVRADSARTIVSCTRVSSTPATASWALAKMSANGRTSTCTAGCGEHRMSTAAFTPVNCRELCGWSVRYAW